MNSFQAPNLEADPGPPILSHGATISAAAFAREANVYTRYLRRAYRERLLAGDDAGVTSVAHSARIVERAAVVHASAVTLSSLRGRAHDDPATAADAAAAKSYLIGVQTRLADALRARDVQTLDRVADAAEAAMHALAHPDAAFADISDLPLTAAEYQNGSPFPNDMDSGEYDPNYLDADSAEQGWKRSHTSMISQMFPWMGVASGNMGPGNPAPGGKRKGCCGFFSNLNTTDRIVIFIYLLMLGAALVAVGFITAQFVDGRRNPGSFLRPRTSDSLPVPVVTLCLSQTAVPFSRLQLFNFTDARGRSFIGTNPKGDYKDSISPEFDRTVERFWDNPDNENCTEKLGDYFPFPTQSLNDIAAGRTTSRCRPCYRMGSKVAVEALSTNFTSSSSILAYTDNYFLECLKRPGGLTDKSRDFLHEFIGKNVNELATFNVLRADGGNKSDLSASDIAKLSKTQLCNVFYFGLFPKKLGRLPENDLQIQYVYDNVTWVNRGTGPEFIPPEEKPESNSFPLESLQFFVSSNSTAQPGSLKGQRDMALIGPNTQTYASFRPLNVYSVSRYDVQTSTSNFIDSDVAPLFGYWLSYRIFYNYNRFITDVYYQESTYSFSQWFIDFTGYLSLFTGASIFSVFLLPVLYSVRVRQRKKLRTENPEAYFWSKYRRKFGLTRFAPSGTAMERGTRSADDEGGGRNMQLPGYNL